MKLLKSILIILVTLSTGKPCKAQQTNFVDSMTGIAYYFAVDTSMFPAHWYQGEINASAQDLSKEEYERSTQILSRAFEKYPAEVLRKYLSKVYVLNYLNFYTVNYGGTYHQDKVFITNIGRKNGSSDLFIERLFHAEFSSILLQNANWKLPHKKWNRINGTHFSYGKGGAEAIKTGKSSEQMNRILNAAGFLNEYATSSLENDFNAFAKKLFCPDEEFVQALRENRKLRQKWRLCIRFYKHIDRHLSKRYFKTLEKMPEEAH